MITGIVRAFTSIPGHACDGIIMGYFLGVAKSYQMKGDHLAEKRNLVLSILVPTIVSHGLFDYLIFSQGTFSVLLFFVFLAILFKKCFSTAKRIASENKKVSGDIGGEEI